MVPVHNVFHINVTNVFTKQYYIYGIDITNISIIIQGQTSPPPELSQVALYYRLKCKHNSQ